MTFNEIQYWRARAERMENVLKWYADMFCERSICYEGCGKLRDYDCAGCRARAALSDAPPAMADGHIHAAYEALQLLMDEQNGPPLLRREAQWNTAMTKARAALAKARGET